MREKKSKQRARTDDEYRTSERTKEKKSKQRARTDDEYRTSERTKEKKSKQRARTDDEYRTSERTKERKSSCKRKFDIQPTIKALPRQFEQTTIPVRIKRKLSYKKCEFTENIRPMHVLTALHWLFKNGELYKESGVEIDEEWFTKIDQSAKEIINTFIASSSNQNEEQSDDEGQDSDTFSEIADEDRVIGNADTLIDPVCPQNDSIYTFAPGEGQRPLSLYSDKDAEELSFPSIFCGKRRILNTQRQIKVNYSDVVKWELRNIDRRAANSVPNLFFKMKKIQMKQISDKVYLALRRCKSKDKNVTAAEALNQTRMDKLVNLDEGFYIFRTLRNSPPYLEKRKKDVFAMIRQLGLPTWFGSLFAGDTRWHDLLRILGELNDNISYTDQQISNMTWINKTTLVQKDPITCTRYFDHRVQQFINTVLKSDHAPIGTLTDFFYRVEFQHRGSPHIHMLMWIKDAPKYKEDSNDKIAEYVEHYTSCHSNVPDNLKSLVDIQTHKHSKTCRKKGKAVCRFGFPLPPMSRTMILEPLDEDNAMLKKKYSEIQEKITKLTGTEHLTFEDFLTDVAGITEEEYILCIRSSLKSPKVFLKRHPCEVRINPYMTSLLEAWNANHDLQFVLDPYACAVYIVAYISKSQRGMSLLLDEACKEARRGNMDIKRQVRHIGNKFLNSVEVSAQEAAYLTLQLPLTKSSRDVVFINTSEPQNRTFLLKQKDVLEKLPQDSTDIESDNIVKRYAKRPKQLQKMCLADYVAELDISYPKKMSSPEEINDDDLSKSDSEDEDDPDNVDNWTEITLPNDNKCAEYEHHTDEIDSALQRAHDDLNDEFDKIAPLTQHTEQEDEQEGSHQSKQFIYYKPETAAHQEYDIGVDLGISQTAAHVEHSPTLLPNEEYLQLVRHLNLKQKEFFLHVLHWVKTRDEPLYAFLTGGAGVGKSVVIKALYQALKRCLCSVEGENPDNCKVLLCAPTGKAAHNINGTTIHAAFKILPNRGYQNYHVDSDTLNTLRVKYRDLSVVIIDEVSMVGNKMLSLINECLQKIKGNQSQLFGGVSVVLIGDLYQLKPVMDKWIFADLEEHMGPLATNLWTSLFTMHELSEIMRQKDDKDFAELLNRLRSLENSTLSKEDIATLKSRIINSSDAHYPRDAPHLFTTNKQVDDFNKEVFDLASSTKVTVPSLDTVVGDIPANVKDRLIQALQNVSTTNTAGLMNVVPIAVGMPYEITANLNIQDGLVNGACCHVRKIEYKQENTDRPSIIWVQFEDNSTGLETRRTYNHLRSPNIDNTWTPIFDTQRNFMYNRKSFIRIQFPIRPAAAKTIHKSQGCTLKKVVVDMTSVRKQPHMHYVALSRVRNLSDLFILNLNEEKISVDYSVTEEMQRLRSQATLNLCYIPPYTLSPQKLKVAFLNVRSLMLHHKDIKGDYNIIGADVLAFAETKLKPNISDESLILDGFHIKRNDQQLTHGCAHHGLAMYFGNNLDVSDIYTFTSFDFECMVTNVKKT
ncbi:uncharacterized protein [Argopecten irradians]|uniref:uncharacterized protein n=1 Tax=Argopecten irradians TaxID=31199 RepID=UPI0037243341